MSASNKSGGSNSCCVCNNCFKTNKTGTRKLNSQRQTNNTAGTHCCQGCGKPVNHRLLRCKAHNTMWWECQPGCYDCKVGNPPIPPWPRKYSNPQSLLKSYRPLLSEFLPWWEEVFYEDTNEYIPVQLDNEGLRKS